jgi:hypothetical protein
VIKSVSGGIGRRQSDLGRFDEIKPFPQWAPDHCARVLVEVGGEVGGGAGAPFLEDGVGAAVDFFEVVLHVFDQEDVVVEGFFVFWVAGVVAGEEVRGAAAGLDAADVVVVVVVAGAGGGGGAGFILGDEVEAFPHGFVEFGVGFVDDEADLERFVAASRRGGGEHAFDGGGEAGKGAHEGDDAFTLFKLDFGVFDTAHLVVDEAMEKAEESVVEGAEGASQVFLVGVFVGQEGAFQ